MKTTSHLAAVKAVVIATCTLAVISTAHAAKPDKTTDANGNNGNGNGNGNISYSPAVPNGWLTAFPTVVQTGTKPTLTWSITHPSTVETYVTVDDDETVTTDEQVDVDISVIGSGVTTGGCDGDNVNWVPAQALISVDGGTPLSIFYGTNDEVVPGELVWSKRVNKNTTFRFGGRYYTSGGWSTAYYGNSVYNNIRVLKNGEYPPTAYVLETSGSLKSFMEPYLDSAGRISIGPLDLIIMMELTQDDSNMSSLCYNLQDLVLLMTCAPKGNNGHGNNIDGVDSSNPGNSKPVDPSGTVDDERK